MPTRFEAGCTCAAGFDGHDGVEIVGRVGAARVRVRQRGAAVRRDARHEARSARLEVRRAAAMYIVVVDPGTEVAPGENDIVDRRRSREIGDA